MLPLTYPSPSGGGEKKNSNNKKTDKPKPRFLAVLTIFSALSWWKLCCRED